VQRAHTWSIHLTSHTTFRWRPSRSRRRLPCSFKCMSLGGDPQRDTPYLAQGPRDRCFTHSSPRETRRQRLCALRWHSRRAQRPNHHSIKRLKMGREACNLIPLRGRRVQQELSRPAVASVQGRLRGSGSLTRCGRRANLDGSTCRGSRALGGGVGGARRSKAYRLPAGRSFRRALRAVDSKPDSVCVPNRLGLTIAGAGRGAPPVQRLAPGG
jgi:hypothetical protein